MEPLSTIIVVTQGNSILLVKNKKREWTLPGGHPDPTTKEDDSIKTLAHIALYPFYTGLVIHTVHLLTPPIKEMVFEDERTKVTVFECGIEGELRPEVKDQIWLAPIRDLPPHAVSEDIRGILEVLASLDRFSGKRNPD